MKEAIISSILQTWKLRFKEETCSRLYCNQEAETGFEPRNCQSIKALFVLLYILVYSN